MDLKKSKAHDDAERNRVTLFWARLVGKSMKAKAKDFFFVDSSLKNENRTHYSKNPAPHGKAESCSCRISENEMDFF